MEQFYTEGDAAPLGRLNYVFTNHHPEATILPPETDNETESDVTEGTTPEDMTGDATDGRGDWGCKSVISFAAVPLLMLGGAAMLTVKRKKDEN